MSWSVKCDAVTALSFAAIHMSAAHLVELRTKKISASDPPLI